MKKGTVVEGRGQFEETWRRKKPLAKEGNILQKEPSVKECSGKRRGRLMRAIDKGRSY